MLYLHMQDTGQQACKGKRINLKAPAQPGQQVDERSGIVDGGAVLIVKCTKDPCLRREHLDNV